MLRRPLIFVEARFYLPRGASFQFAQDSGFRESPWLAFPTGAERQQPYSCSRYYALSQISKPLLFARCGNSRDPRRLRRRESESDMDSITIPPLRWQGS
jgi:hypothetical protein